MLEEYRQQNLVDIRHEVVQLLSDKILQQCPTYDLDQARTLANSVFSVADENGDNSHELLEAQFAAGKPLIPAVTLKPGQIFMRDQELRSPTRNIALRTITVEHPSFKEAWPDQAAMLP